MISSLILRMGGWGEIEEEVIVDNEVKKLRGVLWGS